MTISKNPASTIQGSADMPPSDALEAGNHADLHTLEKSKSSSSEESTFTETSSELSEEETRLLESIYEIILEKGFKSTTMDLVARRLGMSKRTLYEIFESKTDMIDRVMNHHASLINRRNERILEAAPNVLAALIEILRLHREEIERLNISLFKDMDRLYPDLREKHMARHRKHHEALKKIYLMGVEQGVFRENLDIDIMVSMMELHGEVVKRMEELLPTGITMLDIFEAYSIGFLRSIASRRGLDMLEEVELPACLKKGQSDYAASEKPQTYPAPGRE